jgi:tetratricopeptide (TPR) repeat protein
MKHLILTLACACAFTGLQAQVAPKWADKAKKAVFSVITYDADHKILNTGNGFYIDANATALSDYTLFRGAAEAEVVTADGRQLTVGRIAGANSLYDVLKFRVEGDKKPASLTVASQPAAVGESVYLLPYSTSKSATCTQGKVVSVDTIAGGHFYYTLELKVTDKTVSCPLMNERGEVVGLIQQGGKDDKQSYAISASYGAALSISGLSAGDSNLSAIGIPKALPEDENQALVYLYMASSQLPAEEYQRALNEFISTYPQSTEGYLRRAQWSLARSVNGTAVADSAQLRQQAEADLNQVIKLAKDPAEANYDVARAYYNIGDFDRSLPYIEAALNRDDKPLYREQQGHTYFALQRYAEAAGSYHQVNATEGASTPATLYAEAQALRQQATNAEGADLTPAALAANPTIQQSLALMDSVIARYTEPYITEAAPYFYERGTLKAAMGRHREAVQDFNEFEHILAGRVSAAFYWEREQSEAASRMYQQALDDIDRAIKLTPQDADLWVEKGSLSLRVSHKEEAITALRQAIALDETHASAHRILGYALAQDKKTQSEAKTHLQRAKELGDEQADGLMKKFGM